jgi:hypothetical protein
LLKPAKSPRLRSHWVKENEHNEYPYFQADVIKQVQFVAGLSPLFFGTNFGTTFKKIMDQDEPRPLRRCVPFFIAFWILQRRCSNTTKIKFLTSPELLQRNKRLLVC